MDGEICRHRAIIACRTTIHRGCPTLAITRASADIIPQDGPQITARCITQEEAVEYSSRYAELAGADIEKYVLADNYLSESHTYHVVQFDHRYQGYRLDVLKATLRSNDGMLIRLHNERNPLPETVEAQVLQCEAETIATMHFIKSQVHVTASELLIWPYTNPLHNYRLESRLAWLVSLKREQHGVNTVVVDAVNRHVLFETGCM
jgi:hypothetical protein